MSKTVEAIAGENQVTGLAGRRAPEGRVETPGWKDRLVTRFRRPSGPARRRVLLNSVVNGKGQLCVMD